MTTERILITPQVADQMLSTNIGSNRKVNERAVAKYTSEILKGNWVTDNGEFIKFDKHGRLVDGQHRLMAIKVSGADVYMWVMRGVSDIAFKTIDVGLPRSIGAIMGITGVKQSGVKSAIIRCLIRYRNHSTSDRFASPTASDVLKIYESETELIDKACSLGESLSDKSGISISASIIGGFYAYLSHRHPIIEKFLHEVMTGRDVTNNVVYLLRDRIISASAHSKLILPKASKEQLLIKAFIHYKNGYQAKTLKVSSEESVSNLFKQAIS